MSNAKEEWEPHINVVGNDIWYTGVITAISVNDLIKEISTLINKKDMSQRVHLFISSEGGDISSSLTLYNYLNLVYKHVIVIGTSKLCSAATYFLFTKCDTFVYPNIYVLFHPMNLEFSDSQQAVMKRGAFYKRLAKIIRQVYASKAFRCNWATSDVYLYADDLVKKNIVEGVWTDY